jgi:hypothetical protein
LRSKDPEVRERTVRRYSPRLIEMVATKTGIHISPTDLEERKLARALRKALAKQFDVRERDLH